MYVYIIVLPSRTTTHAQVLYCFKKMTCKTSTKLSQAYCMVTSMLNNHLTPLFPFYQAYIKKTTEKRQKPKCCSKNFQYFI